MNEPEYTVLVKNGDPIRALKAAIKVTSDYDPRITGVHLKAADGILVVEATDRVTLIRQEMPCEGNADIFIDARDVRQVIRALKRPGDHRGFTITGDRVIFTGSPYPFGPDKDYVTVSVPCKEQDMPSIADLLARHAGGERHELSTEYLARLAKAARIAGEGKITIWFSDAAKPVLTAEAGLLRMAVQPRIEVGQGQEDTRNRVSE
jgi:hypothetical protein